MAVANPPNMDQIDMVYEVPSEREGLRWVTEISEYAKLESFNYDSHTNRCMVRLSKLQAEEINVLESRHTTDRRHSRSDHSISYFSESFRNDYVECLETFVEWKKGRKSLVKILYDTAEKLDRNILIRNAVKVVTGAVEIVYAFKDSIVPYLPSWAIVAAENANVFRTGTEVLERTLSKKMHFDVKKAIKEDQELFHSMTDWFKHTEGLDEAVREMFLYGIDEGLVIEVNKKSADSENILKILLSAGFSHTKRDIRKFFVKKTVLLLLSTFGRNLSKLIKCSDQESAVAVKSGLDAETLTLLQENTSSNCNGSSELRNQICTDIFKYTILTSVMNAYLGGLAIHEVVSDILDGKKSYEAKKLRKLGIKTEIELQKFQDIFRKLRPPGLEIDPDLEKEIHEAE